MEKETKVNKTRLRVLGLIATVVIKVAVLSGLNSAPVYATSEQYLTPPPRNQYNPDIVDTFSSPIEIIGDDDCENDTLNALKLLSAKAPDTYRNVVKSIGIIECAPSGSAMYADETPSRFVVGDNTRTYSIIWYAGSIAHDAFHSKLYHDYLRTHKTQSVPDSIWIGKNAEEKCIAEQSRVLTRLKADKALIEFLKNALATRYYEILPKDRDW
ncbi:MAG: hypothetical protein WCO33_02550 [bacterium]